MKTKTEINYKNKSYHIELCKICGAVPLHDEVKIFDLTRHSIMCMGEHHCLSFNDIKIEGAVNRWNKYHRSFIK